MDNIYYLILLIVVFLIALYFSISIFWHKVLEKKCDVSKYQVANLGYNIALVGNKGAGKTTTSAGISHIINEYLIAKMQHEMNDIRIKLYYLDFNLIKNKFIEELSKNKIIDNPPYKSWYYDSSIESVVDFIMSNEKEFMYKWYTNFTEIKDKKSLLENYLLYFLILNFRKNYVISTAGFYNRVSLEHGLLYDPESIELRKVLSSKNFDQDFCNIIFNDEASISRGNAFSNRKDVKLSGSVIFKILERNAFLGTHYTVTMKQDSMNEVKDDRSLQDCNLEIFDRKDDIGTFKNLRKLIDIVFSLICFPYKFYLFFKHFFVKKTVSELFEFHMNSNCSLRKIEHKLFQFKQQLLSFGFIRIRLKSYLKPEDVGKSDEKKYIPYVFYIKRIYCYGVVDTNEYKPVILEYQKKYSSNASFEKVSSFDSNNRVERYVDIIKKGMDKVDE